MKLKLEKFTSKKGELWFLTRSDKSGSALLVLAGAETSFAQKLGAPSELDWHTANLLRFLGLMQENGDGTMTLVEKEVELK